MRWRKICGKKDCKVTVCLITLNRAPNESSRQELFPEKEILNWTFVAEVMTQKLVLQIGPLPGPPIKSLTFWHKLSPSKIHNNAINKY